MAPLSTCWVVTDGKAGMESQCIGLAEALGLVPVVKRVALRTPWRQFSPYLRFMQGRAFTADSDPLTPPWPDLLIATGRHSIAASLHVRKASGGRTLTVQIQNPAISPKHFDLVITPEHDRLKGANVVSTLGALHRITPQRLAPAASALAARIGALPRPYIGVLIGGANGAYSFDADDMRALCDRLLQAAKTSGGSLLITPSRRTGDENLGILMRALADTPSFIWDGQGDNPYFGILGLADHLVVTSDSVNMVSEAVATAKPVAVFDLPGGSAKFARFHAAMRERGLTSPFTGALSALPEGALADDMPRAVAAVRALAARR